MTDNLYNLPLYYDVAFGWDPTREIQMLHCAMDEHLDGNAQRLLEPGCGTGRSLVPLAMYGHTLTGYDNHPAMLGLARDKLQGTGLTDRVSLVQTNFTTPTFGPHCDVAFNFIGSIGHLVDDRSIIQHLRSTAASLQTNGLYLVQLACLWEDQAEYEPYDWTAERDDVQVTVHWEIESVDVPARRSNELSRLTIQHGDDHFAHEDRYPMRLWLFEDWQRLINTAGCFDLIAVYDEDGEALSFDEPITGEDGNCFYVLRKT